MAVQQAELPEIVEWRAELERLYAAIRTWLAEMDPAPTVEVSSTRIIEKKSGEYEAPMLVVRGGNGEFRVQPIALWVIGAEGRVDLIGPEGQFILIRMVGEGGPVDLAQSTPVDRPIDGWHWLEDRPPWNDIPLTGNLFRGLAEACLG